MKKVTLLLVVVLIIGCISMFFIGCSNNTEKQGFDVVTDMAGRKVIVNPGSYSRVLCIGAGALRLYAYIGDADKFVQLKI